MYGPAPPVWGGARIFDSSVSGLGGCPTAVGGMGKVASECLVSILVKNPSVPAQMIASAKTFADCAEITRPVLAVPPGGNSSQIGLKRVQAYCATVAVAGSG